MAVELTKEQLSPEVKELMRKADEAGFKYNPKNPANDLRWFITTEEKMKTEAIEKLKRSLRLKKTSTNQIVTKKLLVALDSIEYEFKRENAIAFTKLSVASMVKLDKAKVSMSEDSVLTAGSRDIESIIQQNLRKQVKYSQKFIKLGDSINKHRDAVDELLSEIMQGKDPDLLVEEYMKQQALLEDGISQHA